MASSDLALYRGTGSLSLPQNRDRLLEFLETIRDERGWSILDNIADSDDAKGQMEYLLAKLGTNPSVWRQLLLSQDSRGDSPMHRAFSATDSSTWLGVVFSKISWDLDWKASLLALPNYKGETPMSMAIAQKKILIIDTVMGAFSTDDTEREKLFDVTVDKDTGATVIHQAVEKNFHNGIKAILSKLNPINRIKTLSIMDKRYMTALHKAVDKPGSKPLVEVILDTLDELGKLELLKQRNNLGQTAIHLLAQRESQKSPEMLTQYIPDVQIPDILKIQDNNGRTVIHYAAQSITDPPLNTSDIEFANSLAELVQPDVLVSLLKIQDEEHNTALHFAARNSVELVQSILRSTEMSPSSSKSPKELSVVFDSAGDTVNHLAAEKTIVDHSERVALLKLRNSEGQTAIHLLAEQRLKETSTMLTNYIQDDQLLPGLLQIQDNKGRTVFHYAAQSNTDSPLNTSDIEFANSLAELVQPDVLVSLLKIKDIEDNTALHFAARNNVELVQGIVWSIKKSPSSSKSLKELFEVRDSAGDTVIHLAAAEQTKEGMLEAFTKNLDTDHLQYLLMMEGSLSETVLQKSLSKLKIVQHIFAVVSEKPKRLELVQTKDHLGNTILHKLAMPVASDSDPTASKKKFLSKFHPKCETVLQVILEKLKEDTSASEKWELLDIKNNLQGSVLQYAIDMVEIEPEIITIVTDFLTAEALLENLLPNSTNVVQNLLDLAQPAPSIQDFMTLTPEQRYCLRGSFVANRLLTSTKTAQSLEHMEKADSNHISNRLREIKSYSGNDTTWLHEITEEKYDNGNTILHVLAGKDEYETINKLLSHCSEQLRSEGSVNRHGQTPYELAKTKRVEELLEWSKRQEGFYYLPTKPSVLVMYSTNNREGYDQEALSFVEVMQEKLAITPIEVVNPTRREFIQNIRIAQSQPNLSALIVVYMSHGQQAHVQTSDGPLHIGDILLTMCSPSLKSKPKILMIQACQGAINPAYAAGYDTAGRQSLDPTPVRRSWFSTGDHYDVQHCDVVSIVASVSTGLAYRNLMIPKFSEELGKADKNVDITEIFAKTNEEVTKTSVQRSQGRVEQICELRSTLTKKLSLTNVFKYRYADSSHQPKDN